MNKLDAFIQHAVSSVPVSGTSLISSLYGDALSHRGGEIWLGSLAALLEGMGFGERFVRTALFRLNKEGWLDVSRIGRRSFYRLSDKGLRLTRRAENKIYRAELPAWDGKWLLLLSEGLDKTTLADVKKQLIWQGFGTLAPSLMLRRRKTWRTCSLCCMTLAWRKTSSFLRPIRRWPCHARRCDPAWKSAGSSRNKTRCTKRLSTRSVRCCRC